METSADLPDLGQNRDLGKSASIVGGASDAQLHADPGKSTSVGAVASGVPRALMPFGGLGVTKEGRKEGRKEVLEHHCSVVCCTLTRLPASFTWTSDLSYADVYSRSC